MTGYYQSLPQDYAANPSKKYPLLVFLHGVGELAGANGSTLEPKVLRNGPPRLIEKGTFPASFTVKGQQFSFIVITPQFKVWPGSGDVHRLVAYLKTKLRVDESRIYVTGLSMGGGVTWGTLSEDQAQAKQYAASVVVCGAWSPDQRLANVIAQNETPVWALHNDGDPTVPSSNSKGWVRDINSYKPAPQPAAKLTIFPKGGHDAWTQTYDPAYKENGMNVYEWMLQYTHGTATPAPPTTPPSSGNKRITVPPNKAGQIYYPDVMKSLNVQPGDTLCLAAGDYDYVYFNNLQGTAAKPIVIMNCGGLVRVGVKSTSTNGAFVLSRSKYFKIEGTGDPSIEYGFDVNGTNAKGAIMYGFFFGDGCTDYQVHHAYVHDCGSFVQAKTIQRCAHPEWLEGNFVMRNVKIWHLKCRNSAWEGFYIGNTHYLFSEGSCRDMKSHHVENLEVYDNDLENMGSDGIQISMADLGNNLVHHNRVVNYATSRNAAHGYGILSGGGSTLRIYNNRVDRGYNCAIQIFGSGINYVYNNVVSNVEYEGINVTDKLVFQPATGYIYNNTIYNTDVNAIKIYADLTTVGHKIYNNLVIAKGTRYDYPQSGFYFRGANTVRFDTADNISYKNIAQAFFEDAGSGDVRLTGKSAAVNHGRDMKDFNLTVDMDNHSRPQNGKYDVGAYEFSGTVTPNIAPVADAGSDQALKLPITLAVQLDGSKSKDQDGSIKSYSWKKLSGSALAVIVTPNAQKTTLTGLLAGTYVFELTVTDDAGSTDTDEVTVTVQPGANTPPVADAGNNITITQPAASVQLNGSDSDDPDGSISSYSWTKISGPPAGGETIVTPNNSKTNVTGLKPGTYVFELTIKDDKGSTAADRVTVTVNPRNNQVPTADAGNDVNITLPVSTVHLNGSASADPDGSIAGYTWTKVSGPAAAISSPNARETNITGLSAGTYIFELTVTDNDNATASARVTVTVSPANKPPVADAGNNTSITLPANSAQLDGSVSKDADGSIADYSWTKISGPAGGTIANPDAAKTTVSGLVAGTYVFELTVQDDDKATGSDRVTIVVIQPAANKPPTANAGNDITITQPVSTVHLDGSASADADGSITKYSWKRISGPAASIATPGGKETDITGLTAGNYVFELTVTDNKNASTSDRVRVIVNPPVNKAPVARAGNDISITLPLSNVQLNGGASSDQDGTISAYAWKKISGPPAGGGAVSSPATSQTSITGLQAGAYIFQLTVTDDDGATASDRVSVTVAPQPANDPPLAKAGSDISITLPVNSTQLNGGGSSDPDGRITAYAWKQVSGPSSANISSPNASATNAGGLVVGSYVFELTVTDNRNGSATDRVTVTVNKAPNKDPLANAGSDRSITLPTNTVQLDGSGSNDPDGSISSYAWIKVSGPPAGGGAIASSNSKATNITGLLEGVYVYQLTVADNDKATASDRVTITVHPQPRTNRSPVAVTSADQRIQLPTNQLYINGRSSYDPDGTIAAYAWKQVSGPSTAAIAHASWNETLVSSLAQGVYVFELKVTDNDGATATDRITVTVLAPAPAGNKAPVAATQGNQVIQSPISYIYATGKASYDPDGSIVSYSWKKISGAGNVVIEQPNTMETQITGLQTGQYAFQLTVTDNKQATNSTTFTVDVLADKTTRPIDSIALWPNPAITFIRAAVRYLGTGQKLYFSVYDMTGRSQAMFSHPLTAQTLQKDLDISRLPAGYYMLEIKDDKNQFRWTGKFLKAGN